MKLCNKRRNKITTFITFRDGLGSGVSDPYVIMTVGAHTHR